jgi:hypothetical protein
MMERAEEGRLSGYSGSSAATAAVFNDEGDFNNSHNYNYNTNEFFISMLTLQTNGQLHKSKEKQATNKTMTITEFKTTQRAKHYSLTYLLTYSMEQSPS